MKPISGMTATRGLEALRALVLAVILEDRALAAGPGYLAMTGVPVTEPAGRRTRAGTTGSTPPPARTPRPSGTG